MIVSNLTMASNIILRCDMIESNIITTESIMKYIYIYVKYCFRPKL